MESRRNPFNPGEGHNPTYLAGRDDPEKTFRRLLESSSQARGNLIVTGLRGTGKTVLLHRFQEICQEYGWLHVSREFTEREYSEEDFHRAVMTDLLKKGRSLSTLSSLKHLGSGLAEILSDTTIGYGDAYLKLGKLTERPLPEDSFLELFDEMGKVLEHSSKTKGLVILYDEFQTIFDVKSKGQHPLKNFLSGFSQSQSKGTPFILVVAGLPQIQTNLHNARNNSERMFKKETLAALSPEQTRRAFTETLQETGVVFDDDLLDYLHVASGGYPYFIQFYGQFIFENVPKDTISLDDVRQIEGALLRDLDAGFFDGRWDLASDNEQDVLVAMSHLGDKAKLEGIVSEAAPKYSYTRVHGLVDRLVEKGLLYQPRRGIYSFTVPLFSQFITRNNL